MENLNMKELFEEFQKTTLADMPEQAQTGLSEFLILALLIG